MAEGGREGNVVIIAAGITPDGRHPGTIQASACLKKKQKAMFAADADAFRPRRD